MGARTIVQQCATVGEGDPAGAKILIAGGIDVANRYGAGADRRTAVVSVVTGKCQHTGSCLG